MSGHKRRKFLIKRAFQIRLLLGYCFFVLSGGLLFILLMGFFSYESMTISYNSNDLQMVQTPFALLKQSITTDWPYLLTGSLILLVAAVRVTHRVAGPLYRFEQTLDKMLAGDLRHTITLRAKDEGKELATKLNTFNKDLEHSLEKVTSESRAVRELLTQAQSKTTRLNEDDAQELRSILWSIDAKNKKIASIGEKYIDT